MLHAFYYVIFVKLADIISHSSTMMKVTALCRYSKIVSTLQIYKNKKEKRKQKWENNDKAKLHPQNRNYQFIQTRCSSEFFQIKAKKKNPQKTPATKPFKIIGFPKGYLTSQLDIRIAAKKYSEI